ncbi:hypothetical protein [Nonomuraea sp. B5E05]|uniref:hypothetical protein n=1 Tax=Nonomuraea sp. B5E05 TaxID=3153569 RepID=UPI0032618AF0
MTEDGDAGVPGSLARVLADVAAERAAQDARWGKPGTRTAAGRTAFGPLMSRVSHAGGGPALVV